jgi:hypothetical protein
MVNQTPALTDFSSLTEVISLPDAAIDWAIAVCQSLFDHSDRQWDCYLRSLALVGVKQWLEDGVTPYDIEFDARAVPDRIPTLDVNGLRVGVVSTGSLTPETTLLPQTLVEGMTPIHLWLLVEVNEELSQVRVVRGLENRQVSKFATATTAESDYELPLSAFTLPSDRALFYLSHFPAATQQTEPVETSLPERVMNVGRWLQGQLDEVAQQFAWTFLDPLTPAVAMRSPTQELETILGDLEPEGVTVPTRARSAYTELRVADISLRLYALVWSVFDGSAPEWSLLVLLGPAPGEILPPGLALRIREGDAVLAEQTFSDNSDSAYLYAQVFGYWDESFTLDILPPNGGTPLTLPTFSFEG